MIPRSSLYVQPTRQTNQDKLAITELKLVHQANPYYGVARFAIELNWNKKKARRIRNLADITIAKRTKKRRTKPGTAEVVAPANALKPYMDFKDESRPQDGQTYGRMAEAEAWVQDFTHILFNGMWIYIATIMELKTRRILGWSIGLRHDSELVHRAVLDALSKYSPPTILHSDQGSEYLSYKLQDLCQKMEVILSCSDRGSPWQNGFQERFYGTLKDELGTTNRFKDLSELYEAVALTIYYYNHKRIHTSLKMSPAAYAASLELHAQGV